MYFRDRREPSAPLHIPEHYSGNAFSPHPSPPIEEETPSVSSSAPSLPAPPPPPAPSMDVPQEEGFHLLPGLEGDRLLLLGLILLLSGEEGDPELLPFLALLFLWG